MTAQQYIDNLNNRFQTEISREHAYRGDLQLVLETLLKDVQVINEPARIACGAPDYILTRKDIPLGYIEEKDVGVELNYLKYTSSWPPDYYLLPKWSQKIIETFQYFNNSYDSNYISI